jgi:hypothetical protein
MAQFAVKRGLPVVNLSKATKEKAVNPIRTWLLAFKIGAAIHIVFSHGMLVVPTRLGVNDLPACYLRK